MLEALLDIRISTFSVVLNNSKKVLSIFFAEVNYFFVSIKIYTSNLIRLHY